MLFFVIMIEEVDGFIKLFLIKLLRLFVDFFVKRLLILIEEVFRIRRMREVY